MELFAYGCGGYGSLQEYLILDKYIDQIKPDIILWQFSSNDLVNNHFKLESSAPNNNHMVRPYLGLDGKMFYAYPKMKYELEWLSKASKFIQSVSIRVSIVLAERNNYGNHETDSRPDYPSETALITAQIMGMVKKRSGNTPVVAFNANDKSWDKDVFKNSCNSIGIYYISEISEAIEEQKKSGNVVDGTPYDPHWNDLGHAIAGKIIADHLISLGYIPSETP